MDNMDQEVWQMLMTSGGARQRVEATNIALGNQNVVGGSLAKAKAHTDVCKADCGRVAFTKRLNRENQTRTMLHGGAWWFVGMRRSVVGLPMQ